MYIAYATEKDTEKIISTMKNKKAAGHDKIKPNDYKEIQSFVTMPITNMINNMFKSGEIPGELKHSIVRPIHKTGKKDVYLNYRPISLLPTAGKIMETYMAQILTSYLEKYKKIDTNQYGYQRNRGTINLLENLKEMLNTSLDHGLHVICIFVDFSRAFETINHMKLLDTLETIGIRGHALEWFKSYIQGRTYVFKNGEYESATGITRRGVPQGSILGPLLYLIYTNNVRKCFKKCEFYAYADDIVILSRNRSLRVAVDMVQQEYDVFQRWTHDKQLCINSNKTKAMHIRTPHAVCNADINVVKHSFDCLHQQQQSCTCNNHIEILKEQKYLGIIVDEFLTWEMHIKGLRKRMQNISYNFYYIKNYLTYKTLLVISWISRVHT